MDVILENEFPLDEKLIYLNHAAVSPWPRRTADAVAEFAKENQQHGARYYPKWMEKEHHLRQQLQSLIHAGCDDEIALLKNTSEALSVVAEGIAWKQQDNIVSSDQEFPSNRIPWQAQQQKHGVEYRQVNLNQAETPEDALFDACDDNTRLITISSVQYATGLRMDLQKIGDFCQQENILFCVDAIQSLGVHDIHVEQCHIDFLMADAHKWLMGPEGIALFYCRAGKQNLLELHQYGWHMVQNAGDYDKKNWEAADSAKRFECGSPNMLGIHALSASVSLIEEIGQQTMEEAILARQYYLHEALSDEGYQVLSPHERTRRAGIVNFQSAGNMQKLHQDLMQSNVICAYRGGGIRLSPHFYTPLQSIKKGLEIINLNN